MWHTRPCSKRRSFWTTPSLKPQFFQTHVDDKPLVALLRQRPSDRRCGMQGSGKIRRRRRGFEPGLSAARCVRGPLRSYLMKQEDRELVKAIVRAMRRDTPDHVVVCVKIRLMDTQPDTLQLVEDLRDSGAQVVALHGRRRATWHRDGPGLCGNRDLPRHRAEAVTRTTSRRWRRAPDI